MRVLLIEDDNAMARSIELMLRSEGFDVSSTEVGEDGIDLGKLNEYAIILLDLTLPDMSGFEVLKSLRLAKVQTPVLILSGNAVVEAKVMALGFGADDYMTKPFHKGELIARIRAVMRRSEIQPPSTIVTGKLTLNLDEKTATVDGFRLNLSTTLYKILEFLSLRKGTILTKQVLLSHLYGGMDEPGMKIIDVFICKLRKTLAGASGGEHYIETIWGRGYVLRDPGDSNVGSGSVQSTQDLETVEMAAESSRAAALRHTERSQRFAEG